ncbi:MAG: AbgT family transporter [Ktedonobacterales bacterium]
MSDITPAAGGAGVAGVAGVKQKPFSERILDGVEKLGNKVPHPVLMFLYLIIGVIVLSQILAFTGVSITEQVAEPVPYAVQHNYYEDTTQVQSNVPAEGNQYSDVHFQVRTETTPIKGLLTVEGIRFIFTSFVANFQNFGVLAVTFIAMLGAGAAEGAGLMNALIRKLVAVAPRQLITFLIVLVGGLSSVASDAGYLILIPLAAAAFLSLRRNPLAGASMILTRVLLALGRVSLTALDWGVVGAFIRDSWFWSFVYLAIAVAGVAAQLLLPAEYSLAPYSQEEMVPDAANVPAPASPSGGMGPAV